MRTLICTIVIVALGITSQSFGQATAEAEKPKAKYQAPVIEEINAAMQSFVDSGDISGAVTCVGHNGKIVHYDAVGLADLEKQKPMNRWNMFMIASMTKPVVATGVMILQDEGKLSVDDKVAKYIPAFADIKLRDGSDLARPITIRDCLTHTSGLAGGQIFPEESLEAGVDELAKRPLAFQPGTKWQYSPGLNVCGRIIEIVSEQPLQDFLGERIFEPLGMNQTTFFPDQKQIRRLATLYNKKEGKLVVEDGFLKDPSRIKAANPSGGLISTGRDMFRFYQMVLRNGRWRKERILSREAVEQMTSLESGELKTGFTPGNGWGLGWCLVQKPQGVTEKLSAGTFGHGGAFGTQGWVDPETKAIYVLMIQRKGLPNSDGSEIRKKFHEAAAKAVGAL